MRRSFGAADTLEPAEATADPALSSFSIPTSGYRGCDYAIEPDASMT